MNVLVLFAVGFCIFVDVNSINGELTEKQCGGEKTEVTITRIKNKSKLKICLGHQIHSKAIITPAHCINGITKEELEIVTEDVEFTVNSRHVSNIFIHPEYLPCDGSNDLAILALDGPGDVHSDIVCLLDKSMEYDLNICTIETNNLANLTDWDEVHAHCESVLPSLKKYLDISKELKAEVCRIQNEYSINGLSHQYSNYHVCNLPVGNGDSRKNLYAFETMAPLCEPSDSLVSPDIRHKNEIFQSLPWINQVLSENL